MSLCASRVTRLSAPPCVRAPMRGAGRRCWRNRSPISASARSVIEVDTQSAPVRSASERRWPADGRGAPAPRGVLEQFFHAQLGAGALLRRHADVEVDAAVLQPRLDRREGAVDELQLDARVFLTERAERFGRSASSGTLDSPTDTLPSASPWSWEMSSRARRSSLPLRRRGGQTSGRWSEHGAARLALEQGSAKLALQLADAAADGGLGEAELRVRRRAGCPFPPPQEGPESDAASYPWQLSVGQDCHLTPSPFAHQNGALLGGGRMKSETCST